MLQYTTPGSRLRAYLSAIPHWLYFTSLRQHQPVWIRVATYSAMVGTAGALIGLIVGVWLYSPSQKYRFAGAPSRIPYRGQKRWHTVFGLVFGVATLTWTFSGSLAFLPFPSSQPARPPAAAAQPRPAPAQRGRDGNPNLAAALRGRVELDDFAALPPRDVIERFRDLQIRELELTSFDGAPVYTAHLADGSSRAIGIDGKAVDGFDRARIVDIVKQTAASPQAVETRMVEQYDAYYLDRTRQRPLPVILALMHNADDTRYYIDPKTAAVVGTYSDRNAARRWLYNGLHSLNFPWLYNHRPLWDIVVITFMLGGMALSGTSIVLAWRAVGRALVRVANRTPARDDQAIAGTGFQPRESA